MNPVLEEIEKIRAARRGICENLDNDPRRILEHYRQLERDLKKQGWKFSDQDSVQAAKADSVRLKGRVKSEREE